ncbi:MAG: 6-carboxytetrahydropterin synthase QueD [Phycisphaerales bacterium]|nr:6-carboxytetrahydropterin synthase QueD [Phycisphaerales bacterium]
MEIFKDFGFEAAHALPHLPEGHKCRRLHGHSYRLRVVLRGRIDPAMGWVRDFADVKAAVKPLIDDLDHAFLNEVPGLSVPTTENLARWIWQRLRPSLPELASVRVRETATSGVIYRGEDE